MARKTAKSAPTGAVSDTSGPEEIPFAAVKAGLSEDRVVFRLIHFWEARNPKKGGVLMGMELLLIDEKCTVIQAFMAPNRIPKFEGRLKRGAIYSLTNFFATANKTMYRVSDQAFTVCFTDSSLLSRLADDARVIDPDRFRFCSFEQLESSCDRRGDLYDMIGHVKLINGSSLQHLTTENLISALDKGRVSVHLQPKEGPVINITLWDSVAVEFRGKIAASGRIPSVLLVTTLNPKKIGGRVTLSSMSSTRVFFDQEVLPTRDFLEWLATQDTTQSTIDTSQVMKVETLTITEIQQFLKTQPAQKATFNCIATLDHIRPGSGWYYVGCTDCQTKVTKGEKTLVCHKCDNPNATGVILFRLEYSVQDRECEATFVFLNEAGSQLIGRKATELLDEYIEANGNINEGQDVPLPDCLSEVLNQTHKFEIKISLYNFRATRQTFTVSKLVKDEDVSVSETEPDEDEGSLNRSPPKEETAGLESERHEGEGSLLENELPYESSKRPKLCI